MVRLTHKSILASILSLTLGHAFAMESTPAAPAIALPAIAPAMEAPWQPEKGFCPSKTESLRMAGDVVNNSLRRGEPITGPHGGLWQIIDVKGQCAGQIKVKFNRNESINNRACVYDLFSRGATPGEKTKCARLALQPLEKKNVDFGGASKAEEANSTPQEISNNNNNLIGQTEGNQNESESHSMRGEGGSPHPNMFGHNNNLARLAESSQEMPESINNEDNHRAMFDHNVVGQVDRSQEMPESTSFAEHEESRKEVSDDNMAEEDVETPEDDVDDSTIEEGKDSHEDDDDNSAVEEDKESHEDASDNSAAEEDEDNSKGTAVEEDKDEDDREEKSEDHEDLEGRVTHLENAINAIKTSLNELSE